MASSVAFVTRNVLATKFGSVGEMGRVAGARPSQGARVPALWESSGSTSPWWPAEAARFHFFMYQLSSFWVRTLLATCHIPRRTTPEAWSLTSSCKCCLS
uniref:Uncharacterized protein n=1 Tax=Alexandrium monilatum TaxID=311494 RepID=A0A7S4V478_9DINO